MDSEARELTELLKRWEGFIDEIRSFFKGRGYTEVFTPILVPYPNLDSHVEPISVNLKLRGEEKTLWLHTSPEYSMKKLLSKTRTDMFQITKAFRNDELSKIHRPEFFMLEWYKVGKDYIYLMDEIEDLLTQVLKLKGIRRMKLQEAFSELLGIELSLDRERFYREMRNRGYELNPWDTWEEIFFRAYIELERALTEPTFVYDFPEPLSALAKLSGDTAQRFELFIGGVEIANGWTEETNPEEVSRRLRKESAGRNLPLDEEFIEAHNRLPDCAGCSIGLDRLFMVYSKRDSLLELM